MQFSTLPFDAKILEALHQKGYTEPTPIQKQAILPILARKDVMGCAQTGTGKTAAFSLPLLQILLEERNKGNNGSDWSAWKKAGIKALIVTPTRELAIQIDENIKEYSKGTGIKHTVIFGGVGQNPQVVALQRGVDILIATPGRLLDLMNQKFISLASLKIFVLDEADRMLDMGFIHDIKKIIKVLPEKRQSLFFSATMPDSIVQLADSLLTNPVKISVDRVSSTAQTVEQKLYLVKKDDKKHLLAHILKDKSVQSVLLFTKTKNRANKISDFINELGIGSAAIHGNKSQNFRQKALQDFKEKKIRVLVATDLASRGIDIDQLSHVINFEIPNESETYVHRIGRTGRAQNTGIALSFCDIDEVPFINDIHRLIGEKIPIDVHHPFHATHQISIPTRKKGGENVSKNYKKNLGEKRETRETRETRENTGNKKTSFSPDANKKKFSSSSKEGEKKISFHFQDRAREKRNASKTKNTEKFSPRSSSQASKPKANTTGKKFSRPKPPAKKR